MADETILHHFGKSSFRREDSSRKARLAHSLMMVEILAVLWEQCTRGAHFGREGRKRLKDRECIITWTEKTSEGGIKFIDENRERVPLPDRSDLSDSVQKSFEGELMGTDDARGIEKGMINVVEQEQEVQAQTWTKCDDRADLGKGLGGPDGLCPRLTRRSELIRGREGCWNILIDSIPMDMQIMGGNMMVNDNHHLAGDDRRLGRDWDFRP